MLVFPASKINLGLNIVNKRADGYHNIETVFFNTSWKDALEVVNGKNDFELEVSGTNVSGIEKHENIVYKAYKLIQGSYKVPPVKVYLHKTIPMGAGLGGGSADAAFFMKVLNEKFGLNIPLDHLKDLASKLGSDCPFFIENRPVFATQKGDVFETVNVKLDDHFILIVYPGVNSNTKEAYDGITPQIPTRSVKDIVENEPIENWKNCLFNDFEKTIFKKYPQIRSLKELMYERGAVYASLSGSGSAVYGIFNERPVIELPKNFPWHLQEPNKKG